MKIGLHQMCSGIDPEENTAKMTNAIKRAAAEGAQFYFAPEMSVLLDKDRDRAAAKIFAETDTIWLRSIQDAARREGIWVHLGSIAVLHEDGSGRRANRTLVIDDKGTIRARYDKIHMFDVDLATGEQWRESNAYRAGETTSAVQTPLGLLGLTICYDVRFSSLFSALAQAGADLIAVPSAFTRPTGQAHWETLLRARAIETQTFVIAAAQSGVHDDGRETYGRSLVIGPWGDVIADLGDKENLEIVGLDKEVLWKVRSQIPARRNAKKILGDVQIY